MGQYYHFKGMVLNISDFRRYSQSGTERHDSSDNYLDLLRFSKSHWVALLKTLLDGRQCQRLAVCASVASEALSLAAQRRYRLRAGCARMP